MVLHHIRAVCFLSIVLILFALSLSSFEYVKFKTTNNNHLSTWNFYANERNTHTREIDNKLSELIDVLEFMVWSVEHYKVRKEYLSLLKQKVILNPSQGRAWQLLLAELYKQKSNSKEIHWSLNNAIKFNKWNVKSRPWLALYCIELNHQLDAYLQSNCQNLIKNLPLSINRNRLAQMIGIDRKKLDLAIERLNIPNVVRD